MKVVVLAGGWSPERDVSLSSGSLIANALLDSGHEVLVLDLFVGYRGSLHEISFVPPSSAHRFSHAVPPREPDLEELRRANPEVRGFVGPKVLEVCQLAHRVFLALHGSAGENGQVQALFDLHGVSYTGSGYAGSLLAMDKDLSKKLVQTMGIKTARWGVQDVRRDDLLPGSPVGYPCVVKPLSCGSSVGISFAQNDEELLAALVSAKEYEDKVLIEERIVGREFSCGVLAGKALPVIEIVPRGEFFDYRSKYQPGLTQELCPAPLSEAQTRELQDLTLAIHALLGLGSYSRTDFLQSADGDFYFLETNTLPGMTPTSLLPQEALAAGIGYIELCNLILNEP